MADVSLIFDAKVNTDGFKDGIAQIGEAAEDVKKTTLKSAAVMRGAFAGSVTDAKAMKSELKGVEAQIKELESSSADLTAQYEKAVQVLEEQKEIGFKGADLAAATAEVDRLAEQLAPVDDEMQRLRDSARELAPAMAAPKVEAAEMEEEVRKTSGVIQGVVSSAKKAASGVMKIFTGIGRGVVSAGKGIGRMVSHIKLFGKHTKQSGNAVTDFAKRIKNLVVAAFVFNIIRKGLTQLRQYMGGLLQTNDEFVASLNAIKVNLATAFQPIYEAVLPAINAVVSALATATAYIAQFISMLFGKTVAESRAAAQALNKQAEALKKTGGEAKKAGKFLASFDQINQQAAETAADEQDGGLASLLEEAEVPEMDLSWLDTFKQKIKELAPDLDYFANLGKGLSDKIAAWFSNIEWGKIQARAKTLAATLAATLGGFLANPALWVAIGHTLAQGLNTALIFMYTFLTTFPWVEFGTALAMGINQFFAEFDWALLGATLAAWVMTFFNFFYGLFTTLDWALIGTSIGTAIVSFFENLDFKRMAETLWAGIAGVLIAIGNALRSIGLGAAGDGILWLLENVLNPLADWALNDLVPAAFDLISKAIELLNTVIEAAKPALLWLWDEFLQPAAEWTGEAIIQALGWLSDRFNSISTWIKENQPLVTEFMKIVGLITAGFLAAAGTVAIFKGALIAIKAVLAVLASPAGVFLLVAAAIAAIVIAAGEADNMIAALKRVLQGFADFISGVFTGDWEKAWNGIKDIFGGVFEGIVIILTSAINLIIRGINWLIEKLNTVRFDIPDWVPLIGGSSFGFNISTIPEIQLPRLAQGGLIQPNRPRAVIVGDNTREEEIVSPRSAIREEVIEGLREVFSELGGLGGSREVVLEVDGIVLGHVVVDLYDETVRRKGIRIEPRGVMA